MKRKGPKGEPLPKESPEIGDLGFEIETMLEEERDLAQHNQGWHSYL